nr:MAG TPA: hypothetical protein [Caudoviricetes sp.]
MQATSQSGASGTSEGKPRAVQGQTEGKQRAVRGQTKGTPRRKKESTKERKEVYIYSPYGRIYINLISNKARRKN